MDIKSAKVIIVLLFSISLVLLITTAATSTNPQPIEPIIPENLTANRSNNTVTIPIQPTATSSITVVLPIPTETPYPKPTSIPSMRAYDIDKTGDIWHAVNPSSYITPENEWVKYQASQLFLDEDGWIKYKDQKVIGFIDENGTKYYVYKSFMNNYTPLKEFFGHELPNNDYWMMPDYYLYNGKRGICSAWAATVTSMMLSGEMSIVKEGKFFKQVIPAKAVMGYTKSGLRDAWVEYNLYNNTWITTTELLRYGLHNENEISATEFNLKKDMVITPVFEFTDEYFRRV